MNDPETISNPKTTASSPLLSPAEQHNKNPLPSFVREQISRNRTNIANILQGSSNKLLVVVGPCSIHDPISAQEYARYLADIQHQFKQELLLVMRVYLEKPRTRTGWKGLINDPDLNNSCDINKGYTLARKLLLDINQLGVATGTEFLSLITPHYISDLTSWAAIGARTVNSPLHRELASGLTMPVGFKNDINGNIQVAVNAMNTAQSPQKITEISDHGSLVINHTAGNPNSHIILRGGKHGANYHKNCIAQSMQLLDSDNQIGQRIMIDCSHDNSAKDYKLQSQVVATLCDYISNQTQPIMGVMLESHLVEGKQQLQPGTPLTYGQSITDGCISWETTYSLLQDLQQAVKQRQLKIDQ